MSKLDLLKTTYLKVREDHTYLAYYLETFLRVESMDLPAACQHLHCNEESFYRLGLCKAPSPRNTDFEERLKKIAVYTGLSYEDLAFLLLSVYEHDERPYLSIPLPLVSEPWSHLEKNATIFAHRINTLVLDFLPAGIRTWMLRLSQISVSTALCLLFVVNFTGQGKSHNLKQFYQHEHAAYQDSVNGMCLEDRTSVELPLKNL